MALQDEDDLEHREFPGGVPREVHLSEMLG